MKTSPIIVAALACLVAFTSVMAADPKADPREKLETAIPEAIRLLEAKEYETFLERFVSPDILKEFAKKMSLKEFAKTFGEEKAARLLASLKEIKDQKPTLDAKGTTATYKLKNEEKKGKDTISFMKMDKFWYIQN